MALALVNLSTRVQQGDVFRDIAYVESITEQAGEIEVSRIMFPYVVVLTQDCDLEHDNAFRTKSGTTQDKYLLSVLVAPLYVAEHVFAGEHLKEIGYQMRQIAKSPKTEGRNLMQNETPRYHYLEFPAEIAIPPAIVDFKHYFGVNAEHLNKLRPTNYSCSLAPLFRERLTQRFSDFLARIGLPEVGA